MVHFKMRRIILTISIVAFCLTSFCQTGTIIGKVFDRKENTGLPGAPIILKGTKSFNAITDMQGNFKFDSIPVGTYDLKTSFVTYGDTTVKGINIFSDTILHIQLVLPPYCIYDKHLKDKTCPICGKKNDVVPIVYGLPIGKMDEDKYYYAGCLVTACQPNWYCKHCKYKF